MTVLLALDTATEACSVAVWHHGSVVAHRFERRLRGHDVALMPTVVEVMAEAGLGFSALDAFVATVGPGTFTGLRIGLAAARGLALAADRPLIGVTTLEAVAHAGEQKNDPQLPTLVLLDARRGEVYAQIFEAGLAPRTEPAVLTPAAAAGLAPEESYRLAGAGAPLIEPYLDPRRQPALRGSGHGLPDAAVVARIGAGRLGAGHPGQGPHTVAPLYLRGPDAKLPGTRPAASRAAGAA